MLFLVISEAEARMLRLLIESLKSSDRPAEQFKRLGIPDDPEIIDGEYVLKTRETEASNITPRFLREKKWTRAACDIFNALPLIVPATKYGRCLTELRAHVEKQGIREIGQETLRDFLAGHFFDSEGIDVDSYLESAERIE